MEAAAGAVGLFLLTLHHPRESPRGHQQQWSHNWAQAHHLLSHCLFSSRAPPAQGQQQLQRMLATQKRYHRIFHLPIQLQQRLQLFLQQQVINSTTVLNMGRCVNSEISKSFRYVAKKYFPAKILGFLLFLPPFLALAVKKKSLCVVARMLQASGKQQHEQISPNHTRTNTFTRLCTNIRLPRPSPL